jgi:hypothetical protein
MRRRSLVVLGGGAMSGLTAAMGSRLPELVDDSRMELRPVGWARRVNGQSFIEVTFQFFSKSDGIRVWLDKGASLYVNGTPMVRKKVPVDGGGVLEVYAASVPVGDGKLRFELNRSARVKSSFEVVMPLFKVTRYPQEYVFPGSVEFGLTGVQQDPRSVRFHTSIFMFDIRGTLIFFLRNNVLMEGEEVLQLSPSKASRHDAGSSKRMCKLHRRQTASLEILTNDFVEGWIDLVVSEPEFEMSLIVPAQEGRKP